MLNRDISSYVVQPLYKHGFKVAILGYDLCPEVTLPALVKEITNGFLKCINYAKNNGIR